MFYECKALEQLNIFNFKTNNETDMRWMFDGCTDDLKKKIKEQNKNIKID